MTIPFVDRFASLGGTTISATTAAMFYGLSRLRGDRFFHPDGQAYEADYALTELEGFDVPMRSRRGAAVIRLSRGASLLRPLPDVLGVAVRLVDIHGPARHQDLLLVTSAKPPILRHALLPATNYGRHLYSSILPYRRRGGSFLIGARTVGGSAPQPDMAAGMRFELLHATLTGDWSSWGELTLRGPVSGGTSDKLRFNPWNTGGGIMPAGVLNRLRRDVYAASQSARSQSRR
jgi:hypothetical protein